MRKNITIVIGVIVLAVCAVYAFHWWSLWRFNTSFAVYAERARAHTASAYVPAVQDNPLRQELNRALSDVLTGNLAPEARVVRAEEGLRFLTETEVYIDAIGDEGAAVREALDSVESRVVTIGVWHMYDDMQEILALIKKRLDIIADIRGLSYRANFQTGEIFNQVIADGGALSSAYITALNEQLPDLESQFNRRSNLYVELENVSKEIEEKMAHIRSAW